jgi:hypothetical protein
MAEDELLGQSQGKKGSIFDRMVAQKAEMVRQEEETATQLRRAAIEQRKERAAAAEALAAEAHALVETQRTIIHLEETLAQPSNRAPAEQAPASAANTSPVTTDEHDFLQELFSAYDQQRLQPAHSSTERARATQTTQNEDLLMSLLQMRRNENGEIVVDEEAVAIADADPPVALRSGRMEAVLASVRTAAAQELEEIKVRGKKFIASVQEKREEMTAEYKKFQEAREEARDHHIVQQRLERILREKEREERREQQKKLRTEVREKRRKKLRSVMKRVTPHITKKGLALAAAKLTLPVAGAVLPMVLPGAEQMTGHNEVIVSAVTGAGLGLMAGLPIQELVRRRKYRHSWHRTLLESGRNILNVGLVSAAIFGLARESNAFKALEDLENSLNRPAVAAEAHDFSPYDGARLAMTDPSQLVVDIMQGKRPVTDIVYAQTMPMVRQETDTVVDGRTADVTIQVPAMPFIYVTPDGQEVARFNRTIMDPVTEEDLPHHFIEYLNAIEELPQIGRRDANDQATLEFINQIEADIGPLESTPADIFMARLLKRNTADKFTYGASAGGGASTVDSQFFKNIVGYEGADSFINPDIHVMVYHPEKYSPTYLMTLMKAIRKGEVIDPATIQVSDSEGSGTIVNGGNKTFIDLACEQLERYMYGKLLAIQPDFVLGYLNNIHMGAIRGREIIGIGGASEVFFGKHIKDLTPGQRIMLLSSIPEISKAIRALDLEMQLKDRIDNHENHDDVDAAMAKLTFTWEDLHKAAIGNVDEVDKDGLFASPQEREETIAQIDAAFRDKQFFMDVPEEDTNAWLDSEAIAGDLRTQFEAPLMLSMEQIAARPQDFTLSREGIVVKVKLPEQQKPFSLANADVLFQTEAPLDATLDKLIMNGMKERHAKGYTYYEVTVDGKVRWIPAFEFAKGQYVPGLGAVVLDENGTLLAKFDRTGQALVDVPTRPGSTMKPIIFAFLQEVGIIKSPEDKVNDISGFFALAHQDIPVENAPGLFEQGMIPWRRALAESRNIPFMRGMHQYFYQGTESMSNEERFAEVGRRMTVFQNFVKKNFGLKVTDIHGNEVTNPADPKFDADLFPIGYTYVTAAENEMVDVPDGTGGTMQVLEMKRSSLEAMAGAFLRLEEPEKFFPDDPQLVDFAHKTTNILNVLGLNRKHKDFDHAWAKTGTLTLDIGTTATFTGEVIRQGDKVRVVLVQLRGQVVDSQGRGLELNQDAVSEVIRKTDAESFHEARPYAEFLIKQTLKMHDTSAVDSQQVIQSLNKIAAGKDPDLGLYVVRMNKDTQLLGADGSILTQLPAGAMIDAVGESRDGLQPVAFTERSGETHILKTGFVKIEDINNAGLHTEQRLNDFMQTEDVQQFIDTDHYFVNHPPNIVILDRDTTSPALATVFDQMNANNQLAITSDELNKVFPAGTIFVNGTRLADYEKENSEATRAMLARELKFAGEEIKLAEAIHEVDPDADLDTLLLDKNGAPARLLHILIQGQVPGGGTSNELQILQIPLVESHPLFQALKPMRTIENQFDQIMRATNSGRQPDPTDVRGFLAGMKQLQIPTTQEEAFLGIQP